MSNEEKQEEKTKPRIAILYQGENATDYRKHVVERLKYCNAEPVEAAFNEEGHEDDVRINERVISDMMKCDGAIALLTKDTRAASACGNLWLEVGLWIGLKSRRTIRIIQEGQPDDWDAGKDGEWPVKLPSNILGEFCPVFNTNDKLSELVAVFVEKMRDILRPSLNVDTHTEEGVFIDELKIIDVLMSDNAVWKPNDIHFCQDRKEKYECSYRKETIGLLCEFLRMRECSWEDWLIEVCFHRLYHLCRAALQVDYMESIKDPVTQGDIRQSAIDEIHNILNLLCTTAGKLLKIPNGKSVTGSDEWHKLSGYLFYRLNLGYYSQWNILPDGKKREQHKEDMSFFCSWAKELAASDYKKHPYYNEGFKPLFPADATTSKMAGNFHKSSRVAKDISKALASLKNQCFSDSEKAIKKGINILNDHTQIVRSIQEIRSSLPQNRSESNLPRIWPMSDRDSELQRVSAGNL